MTGKMGSSPGEIEFHSIWGGIRVYRVRVSEVLLYFINDYIDIDTIFYLEFGLKYKQM